MQKTVLFLACSSLFVPALVAQGQTEASDPLRLKKMSARGFTRKLTVPGETVAKNVKRLTTELRWHKTLSSALAAGRAKGKPVVWIHALGDLKGFL